MMKNVLMSAGALAAAIALMATTDIYINSNMQAGRRERRSQIVTVSLQTPTLTASLCGSKLTRFTFDGIVSATLPQANGPFAACRMWLQNSTGYTVTIRPHKSEFNGGGNALTLLPTASAQIWSDGTNWWGRYDKIYTQEQTTVQRGDTVTHPSSTTSFATALSLPANLPAGTQVIIHADGTVDTKITGSPTIKIGTVRNAGRGNLWLCAGDAFADFSNNRNNGGEDWYIDCTFVIRTTGSRGAVEGVTRSGVWVGDCTASRSCSGNTGNNGGATLYPGSYFPGYDATSVQYLGYSAGDKALNTTETHTIYANAGGPDISNTYVLRGFTILVVIP